MEKRILTYKGMVYPFQCDHMGHMNVMWYTGKFDEATWNLLAGIGVTPTYMRVQKRGMAAIEQQTRYLAELRAGDLVTITSGLLEISRKTLRFFHEMREGEGGKTSATTLLTGIHIDALERTSCPFPEEILVRAERMIMPIPENMSGERR